MQSLAIINFSFKNVFHLVRETGTIKIIFVIKLTLMFSFYLFLLLFFIVYGIIIIMPQLKDNEFE